MQKTGQRRQTIVSTRVLTAVVEVSSKVRLKHSVESLLEKEAGNIGYRGRFMREQLPYLESFLEGKITPPYEVEVQPSSKCNAKCKHCFSYETLDGAEKTTDLLRDERMDQVMTKILEAQAHDLRVESIKFVGSSGDPLVNPKTLDAVSMSKEGDRVTKLFTNGIGLTYVDDKGKMYADHLSEIDYMRICLDSGSQQVFQQVKRVSGFYDVLHGIERLRQKADQHRSPLQIEIGYVITEDNYEDVQKAAQLVKLCGAHSIRYRRDMIGTSLSSDKRDYVQDLLEQSQSLQDDNFQVKIVHSSNEFEENDPIGCEKCYVPYFWVTVGSDGNLYPCGHRGGDFGWDIGNLIEHDLMTILREQYNNPQVSSLPDKSCKVCPPYAQRLNPFIHNAAMQNGDTPCMLEVLREIRSTM